MSVNLTDPIYQDANKAREHLEKLQWPNGPNCPHCGNANPDRIAKLKGASTRPGVYKCNECRKPFSVTVGTVFERSHIPLNKWLLAVHLLSASKKGMSSHQLHRQLDVTYKTAWFMSHRIREAMKNPNPAPIGGSGKTVEADETYIGNAKRTRMKVQFINGKGWVTRGPSGGGQAKWKVVALVERGGEVRSVHVDYLTVGKIREVLVKHAHRQSMLMTDDSNVYTGIGREFASHDTVNHTAKEYVRGTITTNTIEGVFSIFKRGMKGIYQHCGEQHLHRYLAEFDFRYNARIALGVDDTARTEKAISGIRGKRLTYRRINEARYA